MMSSGAGSQRYQMHVRFNATKNEFLPKCAHASPVGFSNPRIVILLLSMHCNNEMRLFSQV